jgi:beta-lactamase regulating signal transducer with metallopeptidase domain
VSVLGEIQLLALAFLLSMGAAVVLSHLLVGLALPRLAAWSAPERHSALWLMSVLPALLSAVLFLAAILPTLLALAAPEFDHCAHHDDAHLHLCFVHLPHDAGSTLLWCALATLAAGLAALSTRFALQLRRSRRLVSRLLSASKPHSSQVFAVVPSDRALCMAVGLWSPTIAISDALLGSLDATELSVLVAHEREHQRRRDAAWQLSARALSALHTPALRAALLRELSLAAEQTCDEAAARSVGDALSVAETIVHVAKLTQLEPDLPCVAFFGASATERRVEALLEAPTASAAPRLQAVWATSVIAVVSVLAASASWHHAVESALSLLFW